MYLRADDRFIPREPSETAIAEAMRRDRRVAS
jgi:hypothetical protein